MARRRRPPSQGWRTFLRNHADGIAAMDLFVVPTISFRLLYGLLILRHEWRRILWLGATTHPTAEWIARQLVEACGWDKAPRYLVHDRDRSYGEVFLRRVRAMGIRDRPTSPRSPWQNGYAERLIILICRTCTDEKWPAFSKLWPTRRRALGLLIPSVHSLIGSKSTPDKCEVVARSSLSVHWLKYLHLHNKKRPPPPREAVRS